jgi:hypothetical protein
VVATSTASTYLLSISLQGASGRPFFSVAAVPIIQPNGAGEASAACRSDAQSEFPLNLDVRPAVHGQHRCTVCVI